MSRIENALPEGSQIDKFVIEQTLGGGGFSIVYRALSTEDNAQVVIKEYLPRGIATRDTHQQVVPISADQADRFTHGRKLFFQEAGTLTSLKHPNIVDVKSFFRANGTVYMVMDYQQGVNLQSYIKKHTGKLSERFIKIVFIPLMHGLSLIHEQGLLHLDIKPGNIYLRAGGNPLLLDFGAAHEVMHTRQFQSNQVVTPGFSPIEQLDPAGYVGPWTDIYALGATMRACIAGEPPPPSPERREKDTMKPSVSAFKKRYSAQLLKAIDAAMAVDPMSRPQSVAELLALMPQAETEPLSDSEFGRE